MISDCCKHKKPKTAQSNPILLAIHVHNHLPGSNAHIGSSSDVLESSPTAVKRSDLTPFQHPSYSPIQPQIIDLTNSDSDDEDISGIHYPSIHEMLIELHSELLLLDIFQYEN